MESDFVEGYYYTYNGEKVEGLLKLKKSDYTSFKKKNTRILFEANEAASFQRLSIEDIKSFVIAQDTFAIVQDIKVNYLNGEFEKDFAKVIYTGIINLYEHQCLESDGEFIYKKEHYVLSKDDKIFFGIWNINKQREEISLLFSDSPDLIHRILNKEFDEDIPKLVALYN